MRWFRRSALLATATAAALCATRVQAACVSGTAASGTPDSDALTLFVLSTTLSGDFKTEYTNLGLSPPDFPGPATDGLSGADNLCTAFASASANAKATFNRNAGGGTVQFTALLSTSTIDAIDRFDATTASKNIKNTNGQCLAASLSDLFTGSGNQGYDLDTLLFSEDNADVGSNAFIWTGTGRFYSPAGVSDPNLRTAEKFGGRYHDATNGGAVSYDPSQAFCNTWVSGNSAQSGSTGIINVKAGDTRQFWLQQQTPKQSCSSGYRLLCLPSQPFQAPTQPGGSGDPQFVGLQGQQFQVHGMPEEFFNLITTPTFQLNSRFTYLASGQCNYNNTECWTHPGTYVDQLGFMFPGIKIKTVAGSHRKGLRVWVNEEEMKKSSGKVVITTTTGTDMNNSTISGEVSISHPHHDVLIVSSPLFTIEVTNSDWFFNFNLMFHAPEVLSSGRMMHYIGDARTGSTYIDKFYPTYPMHGLVGQTWKNARYPAKRMYQGEVDDYMLLDHHLFSTQFLFNLYAY